MNSTVLIYGGGLQAVSTARSLKEKGYKVGLYLYHADYSSKSPALDFVIIDEIPFDTTSLINVIKSNRIDAIIPMSDKTALFLSKNKDTIYKTSGCRVCVPDYNIMDIASDKLKLMVFCSENDFPHPLTLQDSDVNSTNAHSLPYPVLIKPNHSVGARGILKVNNPHELLTRLPNINKKYGACHIQEYIKGNLPYYNVMIFRNSKGEIINHSILEIIRYYPLSGGSSCLCKSIENPDILNLCTSLLNKLNYSGFADFDILQTVGGEYKIIEINPRVPASLRGAAISGVNFPALIVADALGIKENGGIYSPGKYLRYLGLDLMWFLKSPKRFKTTPSWFKFINKNTFYQEGGMKDWKPMISSLLSNLKKIELKNGKLQKKF